MNLVVTYENTKSRGKTPARMSEEFTIGGSTPEVNTQPTAIYNVDAGTTKEVRIGLKELLYVDDQVLMAEIEEEVMERFNAWRGQWRREGQK